MIKQIVSNIIYKHNNQSEVLISKLFVFKLFCSAFLYSILLILVELFKVFKVRWQF